MHPLLVRRREYVRRASVPAIILATLVIGTGSSLRAQRPADQQTPAATFRLEVNSVEVDVIVTDKDGRFIRDLKPGDFQILEEGKPQKIGAFLLVDLPVTTTAARAPLAGRRIEIEPDVRSNAESAEGRVYVIVLDDLHTEALRSARVKDVARRFLEQYFAPGDVAAVVYTSGKASAGQDFTTSRKLLLDAVERFSGTKLKSSVLTRLERMQDAEEPGIQADQRLYRVLDPLEPERADRARTMLANLQGISELIAAVRGRRKAVVFISEGIDYDLEGDVAQTASGVSIFTSPSAPDVRQRMRDAINAAARGNAVVYSIDPRGLAGTGDEVIQMSSLPQNPHLGLWPTAFQDEVRRAQDTLRVIAEQTGGAASVSSNDFGPIFDRIVRENSSYYMLAYTPANERRDGRFRRIEVKVNRPGVQVRARRGYAAPVERKSPAPDALKASAEPVPALRDAMNSPVAVPGLPLRAFAAPFKAADQASVLFGVEVDGRTFKFEEKNGVFADKLEVVTGAFDQAGKFHAGDRHTVDMQLKKATHDAVRTSGLRLLFRLKLPPGRYQIRAAAHETGAGSTGSVHYDLVVPDFAKEAVAVSGIVLTSPSAAATPTARPDEQLGAVLRVPPTAARRFRTNEEVSAYLELYPDTKSTPAAVDVTTSLVAPDERVVFRTEDQVPADVLREAAHGYGWMVPIPLASVPPGSYVLRMEVRSRQNVDARLVREVPLEVSAPASTSQ